jgi:hypothetical protein
MKKQVFISFLMALFAGSLAYGQALPGSVPRPIFCIDGPLTPIAGKEYTYQAASNQTGDYTFWATKDVNFISTVAGVTTTNIATRLTTPVDLLTASANYATPAVTDNVKITWSDAVLAATTAAAPTFVAVNQDGTCTNNFKVWSITPVKAFTVDIRNMENSTVAPLDYGANEDQCFDIVRGAVYNTASSTVEYNYGTQVLYFEVIAANFTNSWIPTFTLSALGNGQTAVIEWAYDNAFTNPATPVVVTSGAPSPTPVLTSQASTTSGVSIYVRVTISNNTFEGTVSTPVSLTVDGVNSVGDWDIENNTLSNPGPLCNATFGADQMDIASQSINPRPVITPGGTTPLFAPGNQTN